MIKRTLFLPLALLLTVSVFSTTAYSEQAATKAGNITELIKTDGKLGNGALATAGHEVSVHYTGWLYDEAAPEHHGKKFDSSRDRGQPFNFPLGMGQVIRGWDQGVEGMRVG